MTLLQVAAAHMAADELSKQELNYDFALALLKVKKAISAEVMFFAEQEQKLMLEYATTDEKGNVRFTEQGRFIFADAARAQEYDRRRQELCQTETEGLAEPISVRAPEKIKPALMEALEGFITFEE